MKKQHFLRFLSMLMALCLVGSLCTPFAQVRATETEAPATKVYDFESDTVGAAPAGISTLVELDKDTLTVANDPKGENGKVMELNHISGQAALTAVVPFAPQTGSMTLQFKVMFGSNAAQYGIYLLDGNENENMGPYLLATATGMLQYFNGNTKVDLQEYKADTWYTVKFVADASQKTYDVYINGEQKVTGATFRKGTFADLDYLFIACQGKYNSKLYIDSIEVPGGDVEVETDKTAPVWAENALSASNVKATSADLSFTPAVDAEGSTKFEVVVGENTAATVDFTDVEELSFALEGATVNDTEKGQGDVYIIKPKNIPEGVRLPVLIGLHGNNGTASVFQNHTGIYGKIKEVALQNGYIFAAISNGADIWGQNNDAGVDNVKKLLDYLVKTYNTQDKAALWAYSGGGVLANRMVMKYPDSVSFVVGTYPVYDLAAMYSGEEKYASCISAWGENADEAIAAINPATHTDALKNHKFYLTHGDADTTVPLATHSQAMKNALGDKVKLEVVSGGKHDSKNWAFHNETVLSAFSENPAAIQVTLSGLSAETAYSVTVKAADAAGNTASSNAAAFTTTAAEGGGEEPVDPPVTPEDPEVPDVAFDFQEDILGAAPKYITATRTDETATVKVVADPTDANNKVMLLENPADGPAPHALVNFAEQTGKFTVAYRVMFGSDAQYGVLLQSGTDTDKQGAYLVSRDSNNKTNPSKVQNINGSAWNTLFDAVTLNQWYSVQIDADVTAKTYDISVTDANGVTKTATGTFRHASKITSLNYMSFETQGAYAGKLYVDDIAVPDPIKVEPAAPSFEKYVPAYFEEQLLTDGDKSTYLAFPTILKLSDEKVLIAYKSTTAHMDVEADLGLLVYNPTTKEVVSKTIIDATVGEAAQNPELMQMPNGDLVIYLDIQRITGSGQQRYGIKELRSTDGGATWKVLAADGTYKAVDEVKIHEYKVLQDDTGIVYGYTFDDVTVDGTVYMLAMSFPEFNTDTVAPGRSVHIIKSSDNGATWTHVKNLTTTFGIAFNESTLEACEGGFIVNCRKDSDGKKGVSYRSDMDFNVLVEEDYSDYSDILKTTHRPKMFIEDGKYYLLGRNILTGTTTLGLYEIDPVTLVPLNYIELNDLPGHSTGNSFYAEYYLQDDENGNTYFNVITYDDALNKGHPDIVRYEYVWEELLTQTPVTPVWASGAVSVENVMQTTADVVFKAPSDNEFVTDYTITLNGETAGTIDFEQIQEVTGTLEGAKGKSDGSYYIAMPKNIPAGMKLPVVIAVHGSGRGALDYRDTPFYAEQKNIALANGYIFAAISNGSDTWGLDTGLENLNAFYDFLIANYPVQEKAALWATSAGGTLTNRMVKDHPEKVSFVLGTFPVYDLIAGFNVNSCKTAWGTTDLEAFKTLIDGKNPAQFPEALKNHDYYIAQGDADTAVPLADHSQKMVADVGSNVHLQVIEGGVHGTSDYSFYGDIIEQAFDEHPAVYTYALSGLTAASDYTVAITAADADGFTAVSNAVSFKTLAEGQTPGEPDDPEVPEEPTYVTYDFEGEDPLDAFKLVDTTENSPITVAEDPSNAENHVMKIVKAEQAVDGTANKANVAFEKQEGTFTASFKVRIGANSRFVINLYSGENLGPRILLEPDGRVRIKNGGSWVNKSTYTADTWYTFEFEANAETDTYNVRVNDQLIAEGMAFEKSAESLDSLTFATFGAYSAEVYVDDVTVPEPPVPLYYTPEYMVSEVLFDGEDDLANTLGKYTPFPTILKISEEKVVIVYKRGVSHMDCEADMEAIVYNPTTEQVVSRTMLDATVGEAAQNPEIMQMPNGDLMIYLDVQRIQSGGRQRFGVKQFRSTDEGETWKVLAADGTYKNVEEVEKHGFQILEDDTGIQYGYTFDDVVVGNDVYMLAMSFAEFNNDKAAPGRSTHIIKSSDNGATWTHIKNLNEEFNFAFNESTLEPCGDGYMIVARGDSGAIPKTFLVDKDFNLVKEQDYAEHTDTVTALGRPKLFVEDGKYYLLTRNRTGTFIMALYELDPETLEIVNYISLDQFTGDSCYAESFFHEKHGQKFLNVINYGDRSGDGKPDIVRTEYIWEELVTKQPVEVKAHTYDCEAEKAEYLKSAGDCETDAVYYKSCSCGVYTEDETFTVKTSGHDWSKADGVCGTCGAVCDHAADNGKDHVCDVCGKELSKCVDADKNGKCDICGADVKVEEEPKPSDPTDPSEPEEEKPSDPTDPSEPEDEKPEDPTTPSEPEKIENPFEDITEDMFCYDAVLWAYHNKITTGKTETTFEPSMDCTRAQVVTFLWRAAGEPEPKDAKNPFPDVADGKYYTKAVLWAVEEGITNGFKDGSFGPNKTCTRGQIVTFLWRYADEPAVKDAENPFPDLDVKSYCGDAVLWAVEEGITTGYKNGTFGPNKNCTRDQIVTFLYRYMVE